MTAAGFTYREQVFRLTARSDLFGVLTTPVVGPGDATVIFLSGQSHHSTNRNRLWVRLGRRLAEMGLCAIRFDYIGVGESGGDWADVSLEHPCVDDLRAVARWAHAQGLEKLIVAGSCFGAQTAVWCPADALTFSGMILLSPPATQPPTWVTAASAGCLPLLRRLEEIVTSGRTRVLLAYSEGDPEFQALQQGRAALDSLRESGRLEVQVTAEPIHGFLSLPAQQLVIDLVQEWLQRTLGARADPGGDGRDE